MRKQMLFVIIGLGLVACSGSKPPPQASTTPTAAPAPAQATFMDDQLRALEKAKAVEAKLQKAKDAQDKQIDEASGK
jgi:hypothetical protein